MITRPTNSPDQATTFMLSASECANAVPTIHHDVAMPCRYLPCVEHGGLCAYHGTEIDRCPWCHSQWSVIDQSGWHSCESPHSWGTPERQWRIERAKQMRLSASCDGNESVHCTHESVPATDASPASNPHGTRSQGTKGIVLVECRDCDEVYGVMIETAASAHCSRCRGKVTVIGAPADHGYPRWDNSRDAKPIHQAVASMGGAA